MIRMLTFIAVNEQVAIWIDGRLVHASGFGTNDNNKQVTLRAGHRHRIRVEYINPDGRAELKVLWCSRFIDRQRLPVESLFLTN